jgi:hypothetical protein
MQNFSRQYYQSFFRAALLICVLTGLLFSCGEGIRLFPFPLPETAQNAKWKSSGEIGYQENVHRFESKQENYQPNFQRDKIKHHLTNGFKALNISLSFALPARRKTDFSINSQFFKSRFIAASLASRPPPVS